MSGNWGYVVACGIAIAVAFAELVTRYRDQPSDLVRSLSAWVYAGLNAAAAAAALVLIRAFEWKFGASGETVGLTRVLVAGFGSLALFRSSLFKVRVGEADVDIGPSTLINMALNAADLGVNRNQARLRSRYVKKKMKNVSFEKAKAALPAYCLNLMESVSEADQTRLSDEIKALEADNMTDQMKSYNLGISILRVTGVAILSTAVDDTRDQFT
ncbi:MAG: hypothetical protein R8F63_18475 [Acidimicrobiales bacterium]|nr:hypothetical protein [Acidimicrobiales bacterium]